MSVQQVHQQCMNQAINITGLANKSKKELQDIASAINISNRLKKKELEEGIATSLLKFYYQHNQKNVEPRQFNMFQQAFDRFSILQQIWTKFIDILQKNNISQQLNGSNAQIQQQQPQQQNQSSQLQYIAAQQQTQQQQQLQQNQQLLAMQQNQHQTQQQQQYLQQQQTQYQQQQYQQYQLQQQYQQQQFQQQISNNPNLSQSQQQQQIQIYNMQQLQKQQQLFGTQGYPGIAGAGVQQYPGQQAQHFQTAVNQLNGGVVNNTTASTTVNGGQNVGKFQNQVSAGQQHQCLCFYFQKLRASANDDQIITCVNEGCNRRYHEACLKIKHNDTDFKQNFECFNCILQKLDPIHTLVHEIVPPTPLRQTGALLNQISFLLTQEQYNVLFKKSEPHYLEVRCIRVDPKYLYETTWPDYGEMEVNDHKVMEYKPLQMNSSLKKRKDEKFYLREPQILKEGQNTIMVKEFQGTQDQRQNFRIGDQIHVFAVYIVKKLTIEGLSKKVRAESTRSEADCRQLIINQFKQENEHVQIDKLNVSLSCIIDMQMITGTPARGRWCAHNSCFSLENFISITEGNIPRKWKCPQCKKKCYDMVVDEYMSNIIAENKKKNLQVTDVTFDQNGNYQIEQIDNDDSDMDEEGNNNHNSEQQNGTKLESQTKIQEESAPAPAPGQQVIILDSDEEEAAQQKQQSKPEQPKLTNQTSSKSNGENLKQQIQQQQNSMQNKNNNPLAIPSDLDLDGDEGPFEIEKIQEPEEHQKIKEHFTKSLKESQFFYKDESFDKFIQENYEEEKHEFNSEKIPYISSYKITKNIKKQYPEIFSVLKKDMVIPTQSDLYYQQMQRQNSVVDPNQQQFEQQGYQQHPYANLPPQFQAAYKPFGYPYNGQQQQQQQQQLQQQQLKKNGSKQLQQTQEESKIQEEQVEKKKKNEPICIIDD